MRSQHGKNLASGKRWKPPSRKRGARNEERKAYYKILLDKALEIAKKVNDSYKKIEKLKRVREALEESFRRFNYHDPFDKTNYNINDALLELNAQLLEDNEKNKKYISRLQTYLEKMNGQRDRAIEKLMNNMSLSPDELREIIRG